MMLAVCQLWESLEGTDHFSLHKDEEAFRKFVNARTESIPDAIQQGGHYWCEITEPEVSTEINLVEAINLLQAVIIFYDAPPARVTRH